MWKLHNLNGEKNFADSTIYIQLALDIWQLSFNNSHCFIICQSSDFCNKRKRRRGSKTQNCNFHLCNLNHLRGRSSYRTAIDNKPKPMPSPFKITQLKLYIRSFIACFYHYRKQQYFGRTLEILYTFLGRSTDTLCRLRF